jgi:hypothetical protein
MRTPLAGRPGLAGLTRALLLALALGACGGGDENGEKGKAPADDQARAAMATADTAAAADTCTGPPPAFPRTVLTGSWDALQDSLSAHGVTFPNDSLNVSTASVPLCNGCSSVRVQIRSTNLTPCLTPANMKESHPHIVGSLTLMDAFPKQHGWDSLPAGTVLLAFARVAAGPATLVYRDSATGNGKASPATAWMFYYCRDSHSRSKVPRAQWRPRNLSDSISNSVSGTGKGKGPEQVEDGEDGGQYGWMACASGCCQFYTPPPNPITSGEVVLPPQAVGPDGKPGTQQPSWCPAPIRP